MKNLNKKADNINLRRFLRLLKKLVEKQYTYVCREYIAIFYKLCRPQQLSKQQLIINQFSLPQFSFPSSQLYVDLILLAFAKSAAGESVHNPQSTRHNTQQAVARKKSRLLDNYLIGINCLDDLS